MQLPYGAELFCPSGLSVPSLQVIHPREDIKEYTLKHSYSLSVDVRCYCSIANE